jgi:hypothetical protein
MKLERLKWIVKGALALMITLKIGGVSASDERTSIPSKHTSKQWTFLLYMNSETSSALDQLGNLDIRKLQGVGTGDDINILVLRRSPRTDESTKISLIVPGGSQVVKDYGKRVDLSDPQSLVDFYRFAAEFYPAQRYFIDLWESVSTRSVTNRQRTGVTLRGVRANEVNIGISLIGVAQALNEIKGLRNGQKAEILCLDQESAQSVELAYELRDSVQFLLGTEGLIPADGWPYQALLQSMKDQPSQSSEGLARAAAQSFVDTYAGGSLPESGVQQSVIVPALLSDVAPQVSTLLGAFKTQDAQILRDIYLAVFQTKKFGDSDTRDLVDFFVRCKKIKGLTPQNQVQINRVIDLLKTSIIANAKAGDAQSYSQGIGGWLPVFYGDFQELKESYSQLRWSREVNGGAFFEVLLNPEEPPFEVVVSTHAQDGAVYIGQPFVLRVAITFLSPSPMSYGRLQLRALVPNGINLGSSLVPINNLVPGNNRILEIRGEVGNAILPGSVDLRFVLEAGEKILNEKVHKLRVYSTSDAILSQKSISHQGSTFGDVVLVGDRVNFLIQARSLNPNVPVKDLIAKVTTSDGSISGESEVVPVLNSGTVSTLSVSLDLPSGIAPFSTQNFDVKLESSNSDLIQTNVPIEVHPTPQIIERTIESAHPYANAIVQSWTLTHPGACKMMVHYSRFETERYADRVTIAGEGSEQVSSGFKSPFWTGLFNSGVLSVTFRTDGSDTHWGFQIDKIGVFPCGSETSH